MDALLVLLAALALGGLVFLPWMRRRRAVQHTRQGLVVASDPMAGYGFVPLEELDVRLPGPDQELADALAEMRRTHDWRPAAELLKSTGDDWERRWQRVQTLAGAAAFELAAEQASEQQLRGTGPGYGDGGRTGGIWLRTWRSEAPKDAGGAQTHAQFLVVQALRDPGSQDFRMILEEARTVCREAALLAPGSPIPYITELAIARGLHDRPADYEELWSKVAQRAPQHMGAHLAALPYWSQKWHGSREQAESFAERAAAAAPRGPSSRPSRSSRSTSTSPRPTWSAASTRARSSSAPSRAPTSPSARPPPTTPWPRTSATCSSGSWYAPSATPRPWNSSASSTAT
ncbi:hypothetical protein Srufu_028860 [Streptomyces libani subsp. rufus]|nr:hypothetical protein Srufu_028860 [Streptomyces libani subsp. rufus]